MAYTVYELAQLALASYQDRPPAVGDWRLIQTFTSPGHHGFFAALYRHEQKGGQEPYVFVIRGTDDWQQDLLDDALIFMGEVSAQMTQARRSLQTVRHTLTHGHKVCLTGHSLGGGIAALLAAETGLHCVTFNAPGTARSYGATFDTVPLIGTMLRLTAPMAAYTERILNLRATGDVVSIGTGPRLGHVESISVGGCEPVSVPFAREVAPNYLQPRRTSRPAFGSPSLEWQTRTAFKRAATYNLCQHSMDLMVNELAQRPEYKRDLQW